MQLESAAHLERLQATGCPDRRLHRLPALFETLLADTLVLLVGRENGIAESEYEQLRRFTPQLKAMCHD
jgi:16S rRNA U1498 N3-methylase RsmE